MNHNELVRQFNNQTLPKSEWTHEMHLIVAIWHNLNHDFEEALDLVRARIKAYNVSIGTANTADSGYHETITVFWMMATKNYCLRHPGLDIDAIIDKYFMEEEACSEYPLQYYTKAAHFSKEARKQWINGDIKEISLLDQK